MNKNHKLKLMYFIASYHNWLTEELFNVCCNVQKADSLSYQECLIKPMNDKVLLHHKKSHTLCDQQVLTKQELSTLFVEVLIPCIGKM